MQEVGQVLTALAGSRFRRRFKLGKAERAYAQRKGLREVLAEGRVFVAERIAPAQPRRDGRQTPWRGHPVFVAQHATGTCCRSCLGKWHGIAKGRPLTDEQLAYVLAVIEQWLLEQLGDGPAQRPSEPTLF